MSQAASSGAQETAQPDVFERIETLDQLIGCNWDLLEESVRKALSGRMTDPERERERCRWHSVSNKHIDQLRKLMSMRETMDQSVEFEELREEMGLD